MFVRKLSVVFLLFITNIAASTVAAPAQTVMAQPHTQQDAPPTVRHSPEMIFNNGGVQLGGSLHLPPGEGPFPAVVMIHGSEADTREIFWRTGDAQAFLDAGIAVFLYDKRGTGNSGGDGELASLEDLAGDAVAAVKVVRQQPNVIPEAVGLFGVSQGGSIGPLAANASDEVAFVINVSGAAVPLANQEMWGVGNELAGRGFSASQINLAIKGYHVLFSARPLLGQLDVDFWFVHKDPYLDPADYWPQVKQPYFVAYGAQDRVVPVADSAAVAQPVLQGGHPFNRLYVYPDSGHGIRRADHSWSDGHIQTMTAWALAVAAGETPAASLPIDADSIDTGANRWYGAGDQPTRWYASAAVQLPLILLFVLVFLLAILSSLNPFARMRLDGFGVLPRLALGLGGALNLALLAGLVMALVFMLNADAEGYMPPLPQGNWLPLAALASALMASVLAFFAWRARGEASWTRRMRGWYTFIALAAVGFVGFWLYWGVWGL